MRVKKNNNVAKIPVEQLANVSIVANPLNSNEAIVSISVEPEALLANGYSSFDLATINTSNNKTKDSLGVEEIESLILKKSSKPKGEKILQVQNHVLIDTKNIPGILSKEYTPKTKNKYAISYIKQSKRVTSSTPYQGGKLERFASGKSTNNKNKRSSTLITRDAFQRATESKGSKNVPNILSIRNNTQKRKRIVKALVPMSQFDEETTITFNSSSGLTSATEIIGSTKTDLIKDLDVIFYKDNNLLPDIDVIYTGANKVKIIISNVNDRVHKFKILKRRISKDIFGDIYQEVLLQKTHSLNLDTYRFDDIVSENYNYKYIVIANNLPLYNFKLLSQRNYGQVIRQPFIYAVQNDNIVTINCEGLSDNIYRVFLYRKSTLGVEKLIAAKDIIKNNTDLIFLDQPPAIDQNIVYRISIIDQSGIETTLEERPEIHFRVNYNEDTSSITKFDAKNSGDGVELVATCVVKNIFVSDTSGELFNPSDSTILAASLGLVIAKIQIRRINKVSREDEVIYSEIINPGVTKLESDQKSDDIINVRLYDSADSAGYFGYKALRSGEAYLYVAQLIVYPLGIELNNNVNNFTSIPGVPELGRLEYNYMPSTFDHPMNKQFSILTGKSGKNYLEANKYGLKTKSITRSVIKSNDSIAPSVSIGGSVQMDYNFELVTVLRITIPKNILSDADHAEILLSYDSINKIDIVDRIYLTGHEIIYYGYDIFDLLAERVNYSVRIVGKNLDYIHKSSEFEINLNSKEILDLKDKFLG